MFSFFHESTSAWALLKVKQELLKLPEPETHLVTRDRIPLYIPCGHAFHSITLHCKLLLTEEIKQEVRLHINPDESFKLQVLKAIVRQHDVADRDNSLPYLHSFGCGSTYVICNGINKEQLSSLPYTPAHVRKWNNNERVDSHSCLMWIEKKNVHNSNTKVTNIGTCRHCIELSY